jgi:hypothetical protein
MFLPLLTLFTALSISAVAIYYSVAGLMAIFAAAAIPIMIMGGTLEIAKLVTAVWLHKYWKQATWWLKSYLSVSVLVLMFITSMGIFGFLSRAHIEQTSAGEESLAKVETITSEIARQTAIIERAETRVKQLESSGTGADANVQTQIDKEQERIDSAYARIQPAIDEQNKIIGGQAKLFQDELDKIDTALAQLQSYIDAGGRDNIKKAQAMVGAAADGGFGPKTAEKFKNWQDAKQQERAALLIKIQQATNNLQARTAAAEIKRLRTTVETQIAESNKLINRLRANIGKTDNTAQIQADIDAQQERIKLANTEIDTLSEERIALEAQYRKLEAEVGPIKYIAEFIYGDTADKNMLEEAVRWVIVIIIFVFDPLAVLLLLASQMSWHWFKEEKPQPEDLSTHTYNDAEPLFEEDKASDDPTKPGWMFSEGVPSNKSIDDANLELSGLDKEDNIEDAEASIENLKNSVEIVERVIEVEKIVEKIVEVPVDRIVEVEKVVEVIKEVSVLTSDLGGKSGLSRLIDEKQKLIAKKDTQLKERDAEIAELRNQLEPKTVIAVEEIKADDITGVPTNAGFGAEFPKNPAKGDTFLRVDYLPSKLYKWNGRKWIGVDKDVTDSYAFDEHYIAHLVAQLADGIITVEDLNEVEQEEVKKHLENK